MCPRPPGARGRIEELTVRRASRARVVRDEDDGDALLAPLRTALSGRDSISRVSVCDVARDVREPDFAVSLHRAWPVADPYITRFSDRAAYSRGRPEVAREKGRYAHDGRRAHHHQHHC